MDYYCIATVEHNFPIVAHKGGTYSILRFETAESKSAIGFSKLKEYFGLCVAFVRGIWAIWIQSVIIIIIVRTLIFK